MSPTSPPWWISAIDALGLILLVLTLLAMVGHGVQISLGPDIRLSFRSSLRLIAWTATLLLIRRLAWRGPPWHSRVLGWLGAWVTPEAFRAAWPPFLASRLLVIAVAYVAVAAIGFNQPRPWRALRSDVLDLFARFDAGWYHTIASGGYSSDSDFSPERHNSIAFFPGLPMLMRYLGAWLHLDRWVAGIIVITVAFFWALTYLYRLAREDLPPDRARAALMFLVFYPFATCYSAVLTESLFLLVAVGSFFHFRRGEPARAAPFALFAGLLRPNGFLLSVPLALTALIPFAKDRGWLPGSRARPETSWTPVLTKLAVAALPVVGMLAYTAYVYSLTGDPFAWVKAQQAWGRRTGEVLNLISERSGMVAASGWSAYARSYPIEILEGAAAIFALSVVWPITRRFGLPYGLFVAMSVLPPFISMGPVSLGRYTAPLFPIFLWLGSAVPPERRPYWIAVFASGQALVATLFFTWRPPY